jgi:hypothetical protein
VGIARLGAWAGDRQMLEWALRVFLWTREQTPDFGFVVDGLGLEGVFASSCETCALADYVHLAIVLTEAGLGDYWDDVERTARNQLLANQYQNAEALRRAFPEISDRVLRMLHGAFEAAAKPNSLLTWDGSEGCCIGGGLRALYLTWRSAASEGDSEVRVNMGFNRSLASAEVVGYEPWEGRVEVRVHSPCSVWIRAPGHVSLREVTAQVDGAACGVDWQGRYAAFGQMQAGHVAAITYALRERTTTYRIGGESYLGRWRGSTMMRIEPPGDRYPIYRRELAASGRPGAVRRDLRSSASTLW